MRKVALQMLETARNDPAKFGGMKLALPNYFMGIQWDIMEYMKYMIKIQFEDIMQTKNGPSNVENDSKKNRLI